MITNNNSWSLGFSRRSFAKAEATPNKSLDQFAVFIRSHTPSDLSGAGESARLLHSKIFASCANFPDVGISFGFRIWFYGGSSKFVSIRVSPFICAGNRAGHQRPTLQTRIFLSRSQIF